MSDITSPATDRRPIVMIVVGRQRVGKTTVLNTTIQFLRMHGGEVVVWNADKLNRTYSLSMFHPDALEPPSADPEDVKAWLEGRFTHLVEHRYGAALDIGGGDTPWPDMWRRWPSCARWKGSPHGLLKTVALCTYSRLLMRAGHQVCG